MPKESLSLIPAYLKYIMPMVDFRCPNEEKTNEQEEEYPSFMGSDGIQKGLSVDDFENGNARKQER